MAILQALESIVGPDRVTDQPAVCDGYKYNPWLGREWSSRLRPDIVVLAQTTEQVSKIVKAARHHHVPITPKGLLGGGGLGGGGLGGTFRGGILLDLCPMDGKWGWT